VVSLAHQRNMTVLLVTHQPDEIRKAASHVIFMNNGVVKLPLTTSAFFASRALDVLAYLGRAPTSRATSTKA
jgi:ABC-type thiamine transport system ATPase subunit